MMAFASDPFPLGFSDGVLNSATCSGTAMVRVSQSDQTLDWSTICPLNFPRFRDQTMQIYDSFEGFT